MKKFLSMLLALSVVFTYTFGAAGSVFATTPSYPNANSDLDKAYQNALTAVESETFYVDYDSNNTIVMGDVAEDNLVAYTFSLAAVKAAVDKAYKQIESEEKLLEDVNLSGSAVENQAKYYTAIMGALVGTDYTLQESGTADPASNVTDVMFKADFDAYKAALTEAVDKVDISIYSNTKYWDNGAAQGYLSKDTERYDTSAEAAAADVALAKTILSNASMSASVIQTENKTIPWAAGSYNALYDSVFGSANTDIIVVTENASKATVKYTLKNTYSTTKGEELAAADKSNVKLINKTALNKYLAGFTYADLEKAGQEEYDAFVVAQTWLIDNYANPYDAVIPFGDAGSKTVLDVDLKKYTNASDFVQYANNKAQILKGQKNADGTLVYDADAIDEDLNTVTKFLYRLGLGYASKAKIDEVLGAEGNKAEYVTSTVIASNLIDYSAVTATGAYGDPISINLSNGTSGLGTRTYYAKEWEVVKAAIDTYNTAVKAAKSMDDIEAAQAIFNKAVKDVKQDSAVDALTYTADASNLIAYVALAKNAAQAADANVAKIFVKFGDKYIDADTVATSGPAVADDVKGWYIDKGARKSADVTALTAEAKAVIDAYKTDVAVKALALETKVAIAAIPTKVTLENKDAVEAAYNALNELTGTGYEAFVSNSSTLNTMKNKIKALEKKAVEDAIAALPSTTKVTIADKDAVKTVKAANDAYANTSMYGLNGTSNATGSDTIGALLDRIQVLEAQDLNAKVEALAAKDITDADAADVKAVRDAFEAYVAEYGVANAGTVVISVMETKLATVEKKVADAVAAAEEAAKWTDKDVKAAVYDMTKTTSYTKPSKTSVKLTAKADVTEIKEKGYTVKYRFYQKGPKKTSYKLWKTSTSGAYTFKGLKKGTHSFKVKVSVYNAEGKLVAYKYTNVRTLKIK